jgi:hypothetical protein
MPYTVPTYDQFIARFPVFGDKDQTVVEMILAEAASTIDTTWREVDYQPAIMYLTAHMVATDNSGETDVVDVGGSGPGAIASESFGGMSLSYDKSKSAQDAAANSAWGATEYGRRFYQLLKGNKPAIVSI